MINLLTKIADKSVNCIKIAVLIFMIIMCIVVFANTAGRFLFNKSIPWSPEISRFAFIWITFLGTAVAVWEKSNAKVEVLTEKFSGNLKTFLMILRYIVINIISLLLIYTGIKQVLIIWPTCASYLRFLSIGWIYLSIPICGIFIFLFSLIYLWKLVKGII